MKLRTVLGLLLLTLIGAVPSRAEETLDTARAVIARQIDALTHGDDATAYALAAPGIRSLFPDQARFSAMVSRSYAPLRKAGRYAFGRARSVEDGAIVYQEVMIDGEGSDWTCVYEMRRQDDGDYRVNGVRLIKNTTSTGI
ncbi:DUF4864 domain-containing protein [Rhizobium sp. SGZ-381]|uniref:DUF4864 domain-containing protein n=1 Tax=Rhizobium sp. SGZ-381 TaxID=3342800 RepID=UPI00366F2684